MRCVLGHLGAERAPSPCPGDTCQVERSRKLQHTGSVGGPVRSKLSMMQAEEAGYITLGTDEGLLFGEVREIDKEGLLRT